MAASTSKLSSTCKIDENEEQKQQPSISSTNEDDEQQPPVIGGGTEMAIMEMIRPAVQRLDDQVKCTRKSQILLASHIDELSKKLKGIVDEQTLPYDLDIYVRKLEESRKRMFNVNQRLQSLHGRVSQLQRSAAREIQKQRQTTSTQQ